MTLYPMGNHVNGGVIDALDFIKSNPGRNVSQIQSQISISRRTQERFLKILRNPRNVEFRGAPKTGGYYIVDE